MKRLLCHFLVVALATCYIEIAVATKAKQDAAFAQPSLSQSQPNNLSEFKIHPRLTFTGLAGSYTLGKGQILIPLRGDQNQLFYGVIDGRSVVNDDSWALGAGFGYRKIINNWIYGGYLIGDHNRSINKNSFTIINPGIEMHGHTWDFNINGYFPIEQQFSSSRSGWAGKDFQIYSYGRPGGGKLFYDHKLEVQDSESSSTGFDFKVGRLIPRLEQAKVYLGGYYFTTKNSADIKGLAAKLTYDFSKYAALEFTDTYDNYNHNTAQLGLKFTLGGYSIKDKQNFGLAARLNEPLDRGYNNTTVPFTAARTIIDLGESLFSNNSWYVASPSLYAPMKKFPNNGGTPKNQTQEPIEDGTLEHPFTRLTAANYAFIAASKGSIGKDNPIILLASGNYDLTTSDAGFPNGIFAIDSHIDIMGRSADFSRQAVGNERPNLLGRIQFGSATNNNGLAAGNNLLDSLIVLYKLPTSVLPISPAPITKHSDDKIISLYGADNVTLQNTTVGSLDYSAQNGGYSSVVYLSASTLNLIDTNIYGVGNQNSLGSVAGIDASASTVNFVSGANNVITNAVNTSSGFIVYGIKMQGGSTLNFKNGANTVGTTAAITDYDAHAFGIMLTNSQLNFDNGVNTITATNSSFNASSHKAYGINVIAEIISPQNNQNNKDKRSDDISTINFNGGTNTIIATANGNGASYNYSTAIYGEEIPLTINFNGGTNTLQSHSSNAVNNIADGIFYLNSSRLLTASQRSRLGQDVVTINFNDGSTNYITATATGGTVSGAFGLHISATPTGSLIPAYINFNGGTNNITALGQEGTATTQAFGISLATLAQNQHTLNFFGGTNNISSTATGSTSSQSLSVGIQSLGSIVNFQSTNNSINVTSVGDPYSSFRHGIKANATSLLQVSGRNVQDLTQLLDLNYIRITKSDPFTLGDKIAWDGILEPIKWY
jgi:hypothetical protein